MGLLQFTDLLRYQLLKVKNRPKNRSFTRENQTVRIPPGYLLYESFAMDYKAYYYGGRDSAKDLYGLLKKYKPQKKLHVLDWGCGPGRIIRHMPDYFDKSCTFYGTDYNAESIRWCVNNIPGIHFSGNNLSPPLDYKENLFDIIYGISVFTHLSEKMHFAWIKELHRILKNGGILLLTTAGNGFRTKLTRKEKSRFDDGRLIIRSRVKEGHRTFTAFHPEGFMRNLFSAFEILEHIEREPVKKSIPQDIWILKKNKP